MAIGRAPRGPAMCRGRCSGAVYLGTSGEEWSAAGRQGKQGGETTYPLTAIADVLQYEMLPAAAVVPLPYRLFKQCDPKWADAKMGGGGHTVCAVGCLMSSTAMALNRKPAAPLLCRRLL